MSDEERGGGMDKEEPEKIIGTRYDEVPEIVRTNSSGGMFEQQNNEESNTASSTTNSGAEEDQDSFADECEETVGLLRSESAYLDLRSEVSTLKSFVSNELNTLKENVADLVTGDGSADATEEEAKKKKQDLLNKLEEKQDALFRANDMNSSKDYFNNLEKKQNLLLRTNNLSSSAHNPLGHNFIPSIQEQESFRFRPAVRSSTKEEQEAIRAAMVEQIKTELMAQLEEKMKGEFNTFKKKMEYNEKVALQSFDASEQGDFTATEIDNLYQNYISLGGQNQDHSHSGKPPRISIRSKSVSHGVHRLPSKQVVKVRKDSSENGALFGDGGYPMEDLSSGHLTPRVSFTGGTVPGRQSLRQSVRAANAPGAPPQRIKNKNFGMLSRPGASAQGPRTVPQQQRMPTTQQESFDMDDSIPKKEGEDSESETDEIELETLGGDSYSFLVCSPICSINFFFGVFVFVIQITTCYLLFQNLTKPMEFPPNVDTVVRTTQFFAIVLAIVQQDDLLVSIQQLAEGYSRKRIRPAFPFSSKTKWNFAHSCRLIEGCFVLLVTFLVIVQSDNVIDLLMNFTAINFISVLDDISFQLCKIGFFGRRNLAKANEIDSTVYPSRNCKLWKHRLNQLLLVLVILAMIGGWGVIMHNQVFSAYLCHHLFVEFGSNIGQTVTFSSSSGIYDIYRPWEFKNDDRVLYVERRDSNHPNTKRGVFGFCQNDAEGNEVFSWTFSYVEVDEYGLVNPDRPGDPCNWVAMSSLQGFYDIRNTLNAPWVFRDGPITNQMDKFIILCYDKDGDNNEGDNSLFQSATGLRSSRNNDYLFANLSKEGQFGTCPIESYGLSCGFKYPCPILEVQENEKVSMFEILKWTETNIRDSDHNSSVQAYSNPIYISRSENPDDDSLLVFAGSHWIFTDLLPFVDFIRETTTIKINATNASSSIQNENYVTEIANYFLVEVFHASSLHYGAVTYMSDAVQSLKPAIPVGIDWYFPKYAPTISSDGYTIENLESGLPEMDLTRPVDVSITCAFCNNVTNPCMYEGLCQLDGRCKCAHGATGTFCEIPPVSNGICNLYFNKPSFNYDGGDCCASTCKNPKSCGVSGLKNAFGTVMATSGNGYPNCDDTTMKPITFEFYTNGGGYYFDTKLICNNITYMDIPAYALPPDVDGVEVVYLKDGTDCELSLSLQSTYFVLMDDKPYYDITIKYGNIDDPDAMVLLESKGFFNGVGSGDEADKATTQKFSFIALKDCFMDEIPNINEIVFYDDSIQSGKQYIWDKGTPQGEALRWINEEDSIFSSCTERESVTGLTQRYILAIINFATNDILRQITWLSDTHECEWKPGITCNSNDLLTSLELRDFELTGNIPSEIGLLTGLQKVDLGTNKMSGQIPSSLGDLSNLEFLNLDLNEFSGTIPSEIGRLSNLLLIKIEFNHFKGTLPVEMKNLGKAQILNLGQNELSGTLPTEFGELNVYDLVLSANELTGTIPNELGNLKNIKNMYLLSNSFTGTIPESFGNFTDLRNLLCDDNQLTGSIPIGFGHLTQLGWLNLGRNQLTGQIPTEFGSLTKMTNLDLNTNSFTGPIPSELGHMTNLGVMIFFNNQFSALPSELGHLTKLMKAYLNDNQLQGNLSSEMGRMTNLQLLNLYNNFLNGTLATELGNLIQLEDFHVLGNQFTGTLPSEMSRLTKMKRFLLTDNVLSGSIDAIRTMSDLEMLRLDYNQFNGTIPTEIGKMTRLELLALQTNQLRGSIPSEIGHITTLQLMFGNGNQLSGTIPSEIGNLNKLTEWTMFINNLSGPIPSEIGNLNLLTKLSIRNMRLTGTIPSEIGRLSALEQVTWSTNAISGKLPSELGRLSVLRVLHAASNQHSGAIPSQLGRIENLGNVDLSGNYLTGTIPKEIGSLISLTNLVLFNNQLSGMPPELRNLVNLVDLLIYGNRFNGNATIPAGICNGQLSRLLVDCGTVICPANCNCRGVQYDPFYFSCPKPETEMESSVQCSKGSFMNLRVEIVPDNLPEETFWDLTINGTVSLQGSAVTDNGFETCVPVNSCSYFTIYDQYGDGMCCSRQTGFGSYTVFLENTVINYGGYFGASESTQIGAAC